MRRLVYLVATSLDGFIADSGGGYEAFPVDPETLADVFAQYPETCPAHLRDLLAVTGEPRRFDTVVMGRATHQPAVDAGLTSAYPHLRQYVVTGRTDLPADPTVTVVADDPVGLVRRLKEEEGLDIWLCGGGDLAGQLLDEIDELHLKVNPVLLGEGVPLVRHLSAARAFSLASSRTLRGGVQLSVHHRQGSPTPEPGTGGLRG